MPGSISAEARRLQESDGYPLEGDTSPGGASASLLTTGGKLHQVCAGISTEASNAQLKVVCNIPFRMLLIRLPTGIDFIRT